MDRGIAASWSKNLGRGKVIFIRPGHETYPIFHDATMLKLVENACRILPGE